MATEKETPREQNRYAAHCHDCGVAVEAGAGRLYRHHGANLTGRLSRSRPRKGSRYVYVIRCEPCYIAHDKPKATEPESSWPDPIYAAQYAYACGYYD